MKKLRILLSVFLSCAILSTGFFGCSQDVPEEDDPLEEVVDDETSQKKEDDKKKDDKTDEKKDDKKTDAQQQSETTTDTTDTSADSSDSSSQNNNQQQTVTATTVNTTLQTLINNASAGASVTLTAGTATTGTYITVDKAITINGSNLEGLTVIVDPSVTSNVTIKNLKQAVIKVGSEPNGNRAAVGRRARAAEDTSSAASTEATEFKKLGDEATPIYLEGCTIDKFEAEGDVALYLGIDDKKSEIEELCLKEGVEEFTFVEFDKADKPETTADEKTPTEDKSKVGKLSIEDDGIEKINLIGGTFDDVNLADDFSGEIEFKYDKDFADQFGDDFDKAAFFGNGGSGDKIVEKDIGLVEKTATTGNVYSFTMSKNHFVAMNGFLSIAFMTDAQKQWMDAHNGSPTAIGPQSSENAVHIISCATVETPIYLMMPSGLFTVENPDTATGLKTIYGSEYAYADYAHAIARGVIGYVEEEDIVVLDKYRNYNKEAVIVNFEGDNVTIYVNTAAVRKEDVILGNGEYKYPDFEAVTEIGTKVSDINLDGYKPYLIVDYGNTWENLPNGQTSMDSALLRLGMNNTTQEGFEAIEQFKTDFGTKYCSIQNMAAIYGQTLKMSREMDSVLYTMTPNASYPTVSGVEYSSVNTPSNKSNPFFSGGDDGDQQ